MIAFAHKRPATRTSLAVAAAFALMALAASRPARAQDLSEQDKAAAKEHYDKGRTAFDQGKYDDAVKELKQSYMLSRKPAILFNIGQTYKQLGDAPLALHFFQKFVAEAEPTDPNRSIAQAAIDEMNATAAKNGQTIGAPNEPPADGQPGEQKTPDFRHVAIGEAPPRYPVDVKIRVGDEAKAFPTFLYYRAPGEEAFTKVPMAAITEGAPELWARIPKKVMAKGKSVQYYVETHGPDGALYGSSGTSANPNVIVVDAKAKRKDNAEIDDGEPEPASKGPPAYTRFYKPAKYVTAGLAVVALGVGAGFGAYGARLTTDLEKRARESSVKNPDGSWSYPSAEWDGEMEDLDQKGRRTNTIATAFAITGGALAVVSGALFFLDFRRSQTEHAASDEGEEVSLAPLVGPGFAGGAAAFRF